jgi:hypothetical protein
MVSSLGLLSEPIPDDIADCELLRPILWERDIDPLD